MDLIEINKQTLSSKKDHIKHAIKYRKVVRKIISLINIPEVLYKFIFNFVGSAPFPMISYITRPSRPIRPRFFPKNNSLSHHKTLEENPDLEQ